jgi:hypothetical protein
VAGDRAACTGESLGAKESPAGTGLEVVRILGGIRTIDFAILEPHAARPPGTSMISGRRIATRAWNGHSRDDVGRLRQLVERGEPPVDAPDSLLSRVDLFDIAEPRLR